MLKPLGLPTIGDDRVTNDQPGSLAIAGYATGKTKGSKHWRERNAS